VNKHWHIVAKNRAKFKVRSRNNKFRLLREQTFNFTRFWTDMCRFKAHWNMGRSSLSERVLLKIKCKGGRARQQIIYILQFGHVETYMYKKLKEMRAIWRRKKCSENQWRHFLFVFFLLTVISCRYFIQITMISTPSDSIFLLVS